MPFFLVTQTSLVEADDENDAAIKAIGEIRSGIRVQVTVKSDELTTKTVTVEAEAIKAQPVAAADDSDVSGDEQPLAHQHVEPAPLGAQSQGFRPIVTVAMVALVSLTLGYIRFRS